MKVLPLAVITLLAIILLSVSAFAEPTQRDLALQGGAGIAGHIIGGMTGLIVSLGLASSYNYDACDALSEAEADPLLPNMTARESCYLAESTARKSELDGNVAVGSAFGTYLGIALAAKSQGHEGNMIGSALGTFAGYIIARHMSALASRAINPSWIEPLIPDEAFRSQNVHNALLASLSPFVIVGLAMAGYYLM